MSAAVITGVGVASAYGLGVDAFFDGLAGGESAVRPIAGFEAGSFTTRVGAEVPSPTPSQLRDRKTHLGLLAAQEAWDMAGCDADAWLSLGVGLEQALLTDLAPLLTEDGIDIATAPAQAGPRFRCRADLCAERIAEHFGLRGPTIVHVSACAAGALAVAHAAMLIERGQAEVVLCGGVDAMINPLGIGGMIRLGAASVRNTSDACRPFDRRRDGLAIGEGAAVFVVESAERAARRGVRVLARIAGWGSTQDAHKITAPRPDGSSAIAAMRGALKRAGLAPDDIGYINAHGTGTPLNDPTEAKAIHSVFGAATPVSSIKGAVGHLMAASGAIELAACLFAFERDLLPATTNHHELDPDCPITVIPDGPAQPMRVDAVLSNSFGFGGQNCSVILCRS